MVYKSSSLGTIETVSDFVSKIVDFKENKSMLVCYRGQQDAAWDVLPGLWRPALELLEKNERSAIRDLLSVHPQEFSTDHSMFDRLVRMQHFGLPTRLLDVTRNPLVALFFATERPSDNGGTGAEGKVAIFTIPPSVERYYDSDVVSCIANLSNLSKEEKQTILNKLIEIYPNNEDADVVRSFNENKEICKLVEYIKTEKNYFLPHILPSHLANSFYVHPKMSNRRIVAQSGAFIIHGLKMWNDPGYFGEIEHFHYVIPHDTKKSIRRELKNLGIDESTLFPELDRAARIIRDKYS